jgi:hypothetical protein
MLTKRTKIALAVGGVLGVMPLGIESYEWLAAPSLPGLIFSMILSGNVHAFPLWLAAIGNAIFFFLLTKLVFLIPDLFKKSASA